jgi:hypothetical protein
MDNLPSLCVPDNRLLLASRYKVFTISSKPYSLDNTSVLSSFEQYFVVNEVHNPDIPVILGSLNHRPVVQPHRVMHPTTVLDDVELLRSLVLDWINHLDECAITIRHEMSMVWGKHQIHEVSVLVMGDLRLQLVARQIPFENALVRGYPH